MRSLPLSLQHPLAIIHPAEIPFIDFPPDTLLHSLRSNNSFSLLICPSVPSTPLSHNSSISISHRICFCVFLFFYPLNHLVFLASGRHFHSPPHSDHRCCSGSSVEVCRNGRTRTTSSAPGRPSRSRSCTAERGTHHPCLHPRWLGNKMRSC